MLSFINMYILLWVELIERPVHSYGDLEVVQFPVFADLIDDGGHPGATDLSGPMGHGATHLLHDDTVVAGAVQTQLLQDGSDL